LDKSCERINRSVNEHAVARGAHKKNSAKNQEMATMLEQEIWFIVSFVGHNFIACGGS